MPKHPHVHIFQESDGSFSVWLDSESGEKDGVCIGTGIRFNEAVGVSMNTLAHARYVVERIPERDAIKVG